MISELQLVMARTNQRHRAVNFADGNADESRAQPSLHGRKLVLIKVEPSYISSDLFTPYSEPRSTLPSIAEFVRPSYTSERTWGTATSSYGGVGPAIQTFKKRQCGSISRSHRHYGSGCINHCREEELDSANIQNLKSDRKLTSDLMLTSDLKLTSERQMEEQSWITKEKHLVAVGADTASALKEVQTSLYGTSSYSEDFASIMRALQQRKQSARERQEMVEQECVEQDNSTIQQHDNQLDQDAGLCKAKDTEDSDASRVDDSTDKDSEFDEETSLVTHGHMICISDDTATLPDHVIITDLSVLPSHFRRVTTKYTRNRCPMFPCHIPFYLWRKHQLLPSALTSLPARGGGGEREKDCGSHLPQLSHRQRSSDHRQLQHKKLRLDLERNVLPKIEHVARKRHAGESGVIPIETRLPQQQGQGSHVQRHMNQNLRLRFKSDAHTRYHAHFPDRVPDLQTVEPSRRHTFFGYHTSVFRG